MIILCESFQMHISLSNKSQARGCAGGAECWIKQRALTAVLGFTLLMDWKHRTREVNTAKSEEEQDERETNTDQFFRLSRASNGAPTSNVIPRRLGGVLVMLCASHQALENNEALISYTRFHISVQLVAVPRFKFSQTWIHVFTHKHRHPKNAHVWNMPNIIM